MVAVALATAAAAPARAADTKSPWGDVPERYGVSAAETVKVRMSDGVTLVADVYRPTDPKTGQPAAGPFPVVLAQSPYGRHSAVTTQSYGEYGGDGYFPYLVKRGYINAIVDVRGAGASGGDFSLFGPREAQDGVELVRWAAGLKGSSGRVGAAGSSYLGLNQVFTAAAVGRHSPLKAIFPVTTGNDVYRDLAFGGGIPNLEFAAVWLALRSTMVTAQPDGPPADANSLGPYENLRRAMGLAEVDAALYADADLGGPHGFDEDFWRRRSLRPLLGRVVRNRIPAFFWSGWYDVYQRGAPLSYAQLQSAWAHVRRPTDPMRGQQRVTGRYQLTMGPWYHNPTGLGLGLQQAQLAWFDRWLKGVHNGIDRTRTPLHAYEIGGNRWLDTKAYPFAETRVRRLYLGAGSLDAQPGATGADSIPWDNFRSPCNRGIDQWNTGLGTFVTAQAGLPAMTCLTDDRTTQAGALVYTSAPVAAPQTIAGPIDVTLYLKSTTRDAAVYAALSDVAPDGSSFPLTGGSLIGSLRATDARASWRQHGRLVLPYHPYTSASARDLRPGVAERLDIEVYPTVAQLAKGHQLRLTITTGDTALQPSPTQEQRLAGGVYDIQRGGNQASFVDVPMAAPAAFTKSPVTWGGCNGSCSDAPQRARAARASDPKLTVPRATLAAALTCPSAVRHTRRNPVLLVHGTGINPDESWAWNYGKALPAEGWAVCTVTLPDRALGDIQVSTEYVVAAIRRVHALSHRRLTVITHSQGGMEGRWAMRWFPRARAMVDDLIDLASPNHGLSFADACTSSGNCWPAVWQMATGAKFIHALNSRDETPGRVSYSQIYSTTDELVEPSSTAPLAAAPNSSNVAVQDLCPGRVVHHAGMLEDAVVYALVMDAMTHRGPAQPRRVPGTACLQTLMPDVNPADAAEGNALLYGNGALSFFDHAGVPAEPKLAPYAATG